MKNGVMRGLAFIVALSAAVLCGCTQSTPRGIDLRPLTTLKISAGPDLLSRVQRELGSSDNPGDVGALVVKAPNPDPERLIFRSIGLYRENTLSAAQQIYSRHRQQFTDSAMDWKLYSESVDAADRAFISYKGIRFDANHGIPIGVNTKPEILIGVLRQNLFVVVSYTAHRSAPDYVRTINSDVEYVARLLARAGS
jgi:hypothetical protein